MQNRAESLDELAESTDIGFIQSCNWEDHIAEALPFIERGKPVFIDKPMVGSVKDVAKIRELVANGAKIIGSSSARYAEKKQLQALALQRFAAAAFVRSLCIIT